MIARTATLRADRHLALFRRHTKTLGLATFRAPADTEGGAVSVLDVPGGAALMDFLRDARTVATEPMHTRPRYHLTVRHLEAEAPLRVWSAVFRWERCRGLSGVPGAVLSEAGVLDGSQSGMLFVNDPSQPASFWSGGILAPLNVAFVHKHRAPASELLGVVGGIGALEPFAAGANKREVYSEEHFVASGPGATHILETPKGWWAPLDIGGGTAELRASEKLQQDLAAKGRMAEEFVGPVDRLVEAALSAVDRRLRSPEAGAAALHDDEAELLCLGYALGYYGEALDRAAATRLAAEVADGTVARSARKSELVAALYADPAVDLAPELEALRRTVK